MARIVALILGGILALAALNGCTPASNANHGGPAMASQPSDGGGGGGSDGGGGGGY